MHIFFILEILLQLEPTVRLTQYEVHTMNERQHLKKYLETSLFWDFNMKFIFNNSIAKYTLHLKWK